MVAVPFPVAAELLEKDAAVQGFMGDMEARHAFVLDDLKTLFAQARVLPHVLEAISRPAEAKPWYEYRPIFLTPGRISGGVRYWKEHAGPLTRAQRAYGVAPEIIVAIIGVETYYGERAGKTRVLDALVTLAFRYPRRSEFFTRELEHFLLLAREERLDPLAIKGSYAGAMGIPQFISSSYRSYAVDFDGDEVRDLLGSSVDAIGSVANYLKVHGWRAGKPVAIPAQIDGEGYKRILERGLKPHTSVAEMRTSGVRAYGVKDPGAKAALVELQLKEGIEHWVGLQNFYTITRYNHSALYAMAVFQLAEAIREQRLSSDD